MADPRAIIVRNRQIVEPFGHDLQRRQTTARHEHSHEPVPHRGERRLDQLRYAVRVSQEPTSID